jgi:predicted RNase H-like HicB family nuclease
MRYPIIIHKDLNSDFGVTIPDLPGCFSGGSTIEEAINMAQEAAECHIEGLLIDSEPIPMPSDIEVHKDDPIYKEGIWALIEVDMSKLSLKSKRINITMPERLIRTVDQYAKRYGSSRSGLLSQAITEYMASHQ